MKRLFHILAIMSAVHFSSCSKMDDYKKEFMSGGEIVYAGALDSLVAQSGYKRINLKMILGSDPQVVKLKAYWNDKQDSLEIPVKRPLTSDTINLLIEGLEPRTYNFTVYTFDKENHSSVLRNATGVAYGDDYLNSLANRTIRSIAPNVRVDSLVFKWNEANIGQLFTELIYTTKDGPEKTMRLPAEDTVLALPDDYVGGSLLQYRSAYQPNLTSFDTFYVTDYSAVTINALPPYERQLDKALFSKVTLPTDVGPSPYATWVMTNLWNGVYTGSGYATALASNPVWFTFDMGESVKLNRFVFWMPQDRIYKLEAVKSFEIYGSDAPAADGSWDSWTYLMTCESYKPSGSPLNTNTAEDIAYAAAGQEFVLPANAPKTRYIRIKVLSNWGNSTFQAFGELTFYTRDRK